MEGCEYRITKTFIIPKLWVYFAKENKILKDKFLWYHLVGIMKELDDPHVKGSYSNQTTMFDQSITMSPSSASSDFSEWGYECLLKTRRGVVEVWPNPNIQSQIITVYKYQD